MFLLAPSVACLLVSVQTASAAWNGYSQYSNNNGLFYLFTSDNGLQILNPATGMSPLELSNP